MTGRLRLFGRGERVAGFEDTNWLIADADRARAEQELRNERSCAEIDQYLHNKKIK